MTKDKTVTMSRELIGVPRSLLENAIDYMEGSKSPQVNLWRSKLLMCIATMPENAIAAPVVERQPVAYRYKESHAAEAEARQQRQTSTLACDVPPPGWTCSRAKGHDGPCAASQAKPVEPVDRTQLRTELDAYVASLQAERKQLRMLLQKIDQTPLDRWYHEHLNSDVGDAIRMLERTTQQLTYFSSQSTGCAGCGILKHTPLRVDAMGGYVCLTCIDKELDRLLIEESAREAEGDWPGCQEISDLPRVHEVMSNFSTDPTEDNGIAVVQAIVQATTRKTTE